MERSAITIKILTIVTIDIVRCIMSRPKYHNFLYMVSRQSQPASQPARPMMPDRSPQPQHCLSAVLPSRPQTMGVPSLAQPSQ